MTKYTQQNSDLLSVLLGFINNVYIVSPDADEYFQQNEKLREFVDEMEECSDTGIVAEIMTFKRDFYRL